MTSEAHRHQINKSEKSSSQLTPDQARDFSIRGLIRLMKRHPVVTGVVAGATTLGTTGAIVGSIMRGPSASGPPNPIDTQTSQSSETPSATPTEKATNTPSPESTVMPDSLSKYGDKMSFDAFKQVPAPERARYASWFLNHIKTNEGTTIDLQTFAKDYEGAEPYPGNPNDLIKSDVQSGDEDAQTAATLAVLVQRVALATKGPDAYKIAYSAFADPEGVDKGNLDTLLDIIKSAQQVGTGNVEDWQQGAKQTLGGETINSSTKTENGYEFTGTDITGNVANGKLTFIPFTDPDTGAKSGMWVG